MAETFGSRLKHAWNVFWQRSPTTYKGYGESYYSRPDRQRISRGSERSTVTSIFNRIALDVASIKIKHAQVDEDENYLKDIKSGLNNCLNIEANLDQASEAFFRDVVLSMFDEGCVAIVPVDTTYDPKVTESYDIQSMRTGKITEWYPKHVKVKVYNENTGRKEEIVLPKKQVAIIENPLYAVINEPNSTMQRLIRKLSLLDAIDEQSGSGKLDLLIQLPYTIKTETRKQQAENRRKDIESQLASSKYGIAYVDGTERVTQLNRPLENNLLKQIEYLTSMLYSQLNINQAVLDGTADEKTMTNYYNRTIAPIVRAIVAELKRKFLTKTARTRGQSILFFRNPFELIDVTNLAEVGDKMTRNEIMTKNEFRTKALGMKPSDDPKANQLINSNISQPNGGNPPVAQTPPEEPVQQIE